MRRASAAAARRIAPPTIRCARTGDWALRAASSTPPRPWRTVSVNVRGSIGAGVGYLASVRNVALYVARLDDLDADLIAAAQRITGDGRTVLYEFSVWGAGPLLSGRASIVFEAVPGVHA
jgi:hypothetical protein